MEASLDKSELNSDSIFLVRSRKGYRARMSLMDAAIPLIAEKGVEGFSIGELCDEAGMKRTSFYTYFNSIGDLVDELSERENEDFDKALEAEHGPASPGIKSLLLNIVGFYKVASDQTVWSRFVMRLFSEHEPTASRTIEDVRRDVYAAIEQGDLKLSQEEADPFADMVFSVLYAMTMKTEQEPREDYDPRHMIRLLLRAGEGEFRPAFLFAN